MCSDDVENFDATVRRAFARLTQDDLPRAAAVRGWPVRTPEDFERLLLDHLHDAPGGPRPDTCLFDLVLAVELGERMLAGNLCCAKMSDRLRKAVACAGDGPPDALAALLAATRSIKTS
jgi:hypothetical protein